VDESTDHALERYACRRCIGDPRLRAAADAEGFDATCSYCGRAGRCVDPAWLADRLDPVLQRAFAPTAGVDGSAVAPLALLGTVARIDRPLAADVHACLVALFRDDDDPPFYAGVVGYVARSALGRPPLAEWAAFDAALAGDAPAARTPALAALRWAAADLEAAATPRRRACIRTLPADTRLHVPAPAVGANAWLVGALEVATAFAELRPPRAATVALARGALRRPARVLDFGRAVAMLAGASWFDGEASERRARAQFWRDCVAACANLPLGSSAGPASAGARAAADWLAHGALRIDGWLLPAAHGRGRRLVVFRRFTASGGIDWNRVRSYSIGGTRVKYRRIGADSGVFADAERQQREDAEAGEYDQFHDGLLE
jgi:hypothetical protein